MENLNEVKKTVRNSVDFGKALEEKRLTYADVYYRLNEAGVTEFNNILTNPEHLYRLNAEDIRGTGVTMPRMAGTGPRKRQNLTALWVISRRGCSVWITLTSNRTQMRPISIA